MMMVMIIVVVMVISIVHPLIGTVIGTSSFWPRGACSLCEVYEMVDSTTMESRETDAVAESSTL